MADLFSPIKIKQTTIQNRIVLPPICCFNWSDDTGFISDKHILHYERRAQGGTGTIILEPHCVRKDGRISSSQLGIWSDDHIKGIKQVVEKCHEYDSIVLVQLHYSGLIPIQSADNLDSAYYTDGEMQASLLTIGEIHELQRSFVDAAVRAKKAGADGIELHGSHRQLLDQFVSPFFNTRMDEYGGSLSNRLRFSIEIIDKIRKATGENFIISYKLGANQPSIEAGIEIAKLLERKGIDLLHVSISRTSKETQKVPKSFRYSWLVYMGTEIRKHVKVPVIVVGSIYEPEEATYLIENDLADFAAIGKGLLVDPIWAYKAQYKQMVKPCLNCTKCSGFTDYSLCPQYRFYI
ncbi:MAG: NADH:flavin oxidoreductase [Bacillota bacterium]|nr:NADH:flavin oxidoreductase [Bacillota bacterium]